MPHKHTRRERDLSTFDLPPTEIARPLPVNKSTRNETTRTGKKGAKGAAPAATSTTTLRGAKRKRGAADAKKDDAPRAFKRLMALAGGKRVRSGLDDGVDLTKKTKKERKAAAAEAKAMEDKAEEAPEGDGAGAAAAETSPTAIPSTTPKIRPGERLADFAARVDAALPISGLIKSGSDPLGLEKAFRTKKERKMHKLYAEWREEDKRIKDRQAEEQDEAEEREMELDESLGVKWRLDLQQATKKTKKKRSGSGSGSNLVHDEEDMWAELNRKRAASATTKPVRAGIHDVVKAPPQLTKIKSSKLFLKAAATEEAKRKRANAASESEQRPNPTKRRVAASDLPRSVVDPVERAELLAVREEVLSSYRKRA